MRHGVRMHGGEEVEKDLVKRLRLARRANAGAVNTSVAYLIRIMRPPIKAATPDHIKGKHKTLWTRRYMRAAGLYKWRRKARVERRSTWARFGQRGQKYWAIEHGGEYRQWVQEYTYRHAKTGETVTVSGHLRTRNQPREAVFGGIVDKYGEWVLEQVMNKSMRAALEQHRIPRRRELTAGLPR